MYPKGYNKGVSTTKNTVNEYTDEQGKSPYADWLGDLRDAKAKAKVIMQVDRMELGLFGDSQPIGDGLSELRIHYGPGYRVYYGKEGQRVYLLLCGGDKSTQVKDIKQAKAYWQDHQRRCPHGT
jgi:putative addiction module killer protein